MSADRNVLGAKQLNQLLSLKIKRHWPSFLGLLIFSFPLLGPSNFTLFQSFSLITLEIRAKALMSYPSSLIFGTHLNSHDDLNSSYLQLDVCKFLVYNPSFPLSLSLRFSLLKILKTLHKPCCYSASVSPDISQRRSVQWSFETWQIRNWILEFSLLHPFSIFLFFVATCMNFGTIHLQFFTGCWTEFWKHASTLHTLPKLIIFPGDSWCQEERSSFSC